MCIRPFKDSSMKLVPFLAAGVLLVTTAATSAQALNYKSVGDTAAILYDTPSEKGRKVFVAPSGMPAEVVLVYGEWSKVRDAAGSLSWIRSSALVDKRNVVIRVSKASIHAAADVSSPVAFTADQHVLLQLDAPSQNGWLKVRHASGKTGFIKAADVWGG